MLLAGTDDLASHNVSPELLIKTLDDQITEMKGFITLGHIFLCKIPHRFDECLSDTEEFLTVVDTIPQELRFYYEDALHFSNVGLSISCSILLSSL